MARNWHDKSASERGYGNRWRKLRKWVLDRDKHLCQACRSQGRITKATHVDHIQPKAEGGTDDMDNLQSLCEPCHQFKTIRENGGKVKMVVGVDGWPVQDPLDRGHSASGHLTLGSPRTQRPRASPGSGRRVPRPRAGG